MEFKPKETGACKELTEEEIKIVRLIISKKEEVVDDNIKKIFLHGTLETSATETENVKPSKKIEKTINDLGKIMINLERIQQEAKNQLEENGYL